MNKPSKTSLEPIIATRRLTFGEDQTSELIVKIGAPKRFPDSVDFYCPFQFVGSGDDSVRSAAGIDAVQALQLALEMIGMYLYLHLNPQLRNSLKWSGDKSGDLGFPKPKI